MAKNISTSEKYIKLCAILNVNPNPENTVIFFDEIQAYLNDMNRYVKNKFEAAKNEAIYKSIPIQIWNKSNKFQYIKEI